MPRHRTPPSSSPTSATTRAPQPRLRHRRENRLRLLLTARRRLRSAEHSQPTSAAGRRRGRWARSTRHFRATTVFATVVAVIFICLAGAGSAEAFAGPVMAVKTLPEVINAATAWIVGILATLGVFFFTVGGLRYMAAAGDPAEVEKAKGAFKGAAIGFALAVLAPVLMNIVKQIVGA